ncbi:MAG: glucokinase [Desulfovibrionaceae bacterium]
MHILAADIGGTTSRFAHFRLATDGGLSLLGQCRLASASAASFAELLAMLGPAGFSLALTQADAVALGVPGPVRSGAYCDPPNTNWDIDLRSPGLPGLRKLLERGRALMVNDFVAQAWAMRTSAVDGARVIQPGTPEPDRPVAIIGAGTGLGHCALVPAGGGWAAVPSEAGHLAFPFRHDLHERDFERFARSRLGVAYCDNEDVVSGSGLALAAAWATGEDPAPEDAPALVAKSPEALALFARFYGRAARHWALAVTALGGLHITGGVAAHLPQVLDHPGFLAEFHDHPDYADMLASLPVLHVSNPDAGLWGAAFLGAGLLEEQGK